MRKTIAILLCLASGFVHAASEVGGLDRVHVDLGDEVSLQRGARTFVNYCLSCHSAAYMRYNRLGRDLGMGDSVVEQNLMFASDKVGDLMTVTMSDAHSKNWFGVAPPDLSLITRSRGPDWVYTYLRTFYADDESATGWNNKVFPHVAMPHVLYEWQGTQRAVLEGDEVVSFEIQKPGTMSAVEYDDAMRDLTNFLVYLGEPAKMYRGKIGLWVLLFLGILGYFTYLLKKEYWKDVH
ncbi:MAG: cytochrome c1 [Gammaproteobacteria bacterium]|nr:cytochrome c1 [Gammaproteobacteria bacterium]MDH3468895.1 cytochrome c1 [Gammaproteobacteria bacterium]